MTHTLPCTKTTNRKKLWTLEPGQVRVPPNMTPNWQNSNDYCSKLLINLKRHFWGLLGLRRDTSFIFFKSVARKKVFLTRPIGFLLLNWHKRILWGPKRPQKCLCACFPCVSIKVNYNQADGFLIFKKRRKQTAWLEKAINNWLCSNLLHDTW